MGSGRGCSTRASSMVPARAGPENRAHSMADILETEPVSVLLGVLIPGQRQGDTSWVSLTPGKSKNETCLFSAPLSLQPGPRGCVHVAVGWQELASPSSHRSLAWCEGCLTGVSWAHGESGSEKRRCLDVQSHQTREVGTCPAAKCLAVGGTHPAAGCLEWVNRSSCWMSRWVGKAVLLLDVWSGGGGTRPAAGCLGVVGVTVSWTAVSTCIN